MFKLNIKIKFALLISICTSLIQFNLSSSPTKNIVAIPSPLESHDEILGQNFTFEDDSDDTVDIVENPDAITTLNGQVVSRKETLDLLRDFKNGSYLLKEELLEIAELIPNTSLSDNIIETIERAEDRLKPQRIAPTLAKVKQVKSFNGNFLAKYSNGYITTHSAGEQKAQISVTSQNFNNNFYLHKNGLTLLVEYKNGSGYTYETYNAITGEIQKKEDSDSQLKPDGLYLTSKKGSILSWAFYKHKMPEDPTIEAPLPAALPMTKGPDINTLNNVDSDEYEYYSYSSESEDHPLPHPQVVNANEIGGKAYLKMGSEEVSLNGETAEISPCGGFVVALRQPVAISNTNGNPLYTVSLTDKPIISRNRPERSFQSGVSIYTTSENGNLTPILELDFNNEHLKPIFSPCGKYLMLELYNNNTATFLYKLYDTETFSLRKEFMIDVDQNPTALSEEKITGKQSLMPIGERLISSGYRSRLRGVFSWGDLVKDFEEIPESRSKIPSQTSCEVLNNATILVSGKKPQITRVKRDEMQLYQLKIEHDLDDEQIKNFLYKEKQTSADYVGLYDMEGNIKLDESGNEMTYPRTRFINKESDVSIVVENDEGVQYIINILTGEKRPVSYDNVKPAPILDPLGKQSASGSTQSLNNTPSNSTIEASYAHKLKPFIDENTVAFSNHEGNNVLALSDYSDFRETNDPYIFLLQPNKEAEVGLLDTRMPNNILTLEGLAELPESSQVSITSDLIEITITTKAHKVKMNLEDRYSYVLQLEDKGLESKVIARGKPFERIAKYIYGFNGKLISKTFSISSERLSV